MFWRSATDRHQCQNFFALCQDVSKHPSGDGGRILFAFSPTVSVFWHLSPSMTHSCLSCADRNSWWTYAEMYTSPYPHNKRREAKGSSQRTLHLLFSRHWLLMNLVLNCMNDADWQWIGFEGSAERAFLLFIRTKFCIAFCWDSCGKLFSVKQLSLNCDI